MVSFSPVGAAVRDGAAVVICPVPLLPYAVAIGDVAAVSGEVEVTAVV